MIAFCVESSHEKGMGHLFRCLHLLEYLKSKEETVFVLINDHEPSVKLLEERDISFNIVDLKDRESNWESELIHKYNIAVWINDRLDTDIRHALKVKKNNIPLITFDDRGSGSELCDLHFAPLAFENTDQLKGVKVFTSVDYLILNPEIMQFQRLRTNAEKIIISMGGSDTYGVTVKVVQMLKSLGQSATVHIGPSFEHKTELAREIDDRFIVIDNVPSLVRAFHNYDLAITGGGITPFEANASGLPCIIIANETFEIPIGEYLHSNGSSLFTCYHEQLNSQKLSEIFPAETLSIESMSRLGMMRIPVNAMDKIYKEIKHVI